jgi:HEAT repeat protein
MFRCKTLLFAVLGVAGTLAIILIVSTGARQALVGLVRREPFVGYRPASGWVASLGSEDHSASAEAQVTLDKLGVRALPALMEGLSSSSPRTRGLCADLIGRLGSTGAPATESLTRLCADPDDSVRGEAAVTLFRITGRLDSLAPALTDAAPEVRRQAARTLRSSRASDPAALPLLEVAVTDADAEVRQAAAVALSHYGPAGRAALPELVHLLRTTDNPYLAGDAIDGLVRIGAHLEQAAQALVAVLGSTHKGIPNPYIDGPAGAAPDPTAPRQQAIRALAGAGPAVIPLLLATLKDKDSLTRHGAAEALAGMPPATVVPALLEALARPGTERAGVAYVLGLIGPPAAEIQAPRSPSNDLVGPPPPVTAVAELITLLADPGSEVRSMAAYALASVGGRREGSSTPPAGETAIPALRRQATEDSDLRAALWAGWAHWRITGQVNPARDSLLAALRRPGPDGADATVAGLLQGEEPDPLRLLAESLLRSLGPAGLPILTDALEDRRARRRILNVIDSPGPWGRAGVDLLTAVVRSRDPLEVRAHAAVLLGRFGPEAASAVPALVDLLRTAMSERRSMVASDCAQALAQIGPAAGDAVPALCDLTNDPLAGHDAFEALARLGPGAALAVPVLTAHLTGPPEKAERAAAALKAIGPSAAGAIPALIRAGQGAVDPVPFRSAAEAIDPTRAFIWSIAVPVLDRWYYALAALPLAGVALIGWYRYRQQIARRCLTTSPWFPRP